MQPPASPIEQRLRTVRHRIVAGVLATFVAAWLAVAAVGKGGASSTTATSADSSQAAPSTATQSDDATPGSTDDSSGFGDDRSSQGAQGGPVTTAQS